MSNNQPLISIILTSYNHDSFLAQSIESVLRQTYENFELYIIDDCSTDNSQSIISRYAQQDDRIIAVFHEENQGSSGFKSMLHKMKGEYIALLHSDDYWDPCKLEKQMKAFESFPEISTCLTDVLIVDDNGNELFDHPYCSVFKVQDWNRFEWLNYFFFNGNAFCNPSYMMKKECFIDYELGAKGLSGIPDMLNWIKVLEHSEVKILPEKLTSFRVHRDESNTSGINLGSLKRVETELYLVLREFLKITSIEDITKIFPLAHDYVIDGDYSSKYIWAMMALLHSDKPQHHLFGINTLYELINDSYEAEKLLKLYQFDDKAFSDIKRRFETFDLGSIKYASIYYAYGDSPFNEESKIQQLFHFDNSENVQTINFFSEIGEALTEVHIRFDPIEQSFIACKINGCLINGRPAELLPLNSSCKLSSGFDIFLTKDPIYDCLELLDSKDSIQISFSIRAVNEDDIKAFLEIEKVAGRNRILRLLKDRLKGKQKNNRF